MDFKARYKGTRTKSLVGFNEEVLCRNWIFVDK